MKFGALYNTELRTSPAARAQGPQSSSCPSQVGATSTPVTRWPCSAKSRERNPVPQPMSRTSSGSVSARLVMRQRHARACSSVRRPWLASRSKSAARRFQCRRTNSFTVSTKVRLPATSYRLAAPKGKRSRLGRGRRLTFRLTLARGTGENGRAVSGVGLGSAPGRKQAKPVHAPIPTCERTDDHREREPSADAMRSSRLREAACAAYAPSGGTAGVRLEFWETAP